MLHTVGVVEEEESILLLPPTVRVQRYTYHTTYTHTFIHKTYIHSFIDEYITQSFILHTYMRCSPAASRSTASAPYFGCDAAADRRRYTVFLALERNAGTCSPVRWLHTCTYILARETSWKIHWFKHVLGVCYIQNTHKFTCACMYVSMLQRCTPPDLQ